MFGVTLLYQGGKSAERGESFFPFDSGDSQSPRDLDEPDANGGQWNLLGTFTLNPALNPLVELSDQANGRVVADAMMVLPSGVSTDHVTYTPTSTTTVMVDIYAKWSENSTRATAVKYRIQHPGGATDILVNQQ